MHPDTLDALHSVNNAVVVVFAAFAASAVDSNCRKLVAVTSCLVAWLHSSGDLIDLTDQFDS